MKRTKFFPIFRVSLSLLAAIALSACADFQARPTPVMLSELVAKPNRTFVFQSNIAPDALSDALLKSNCGAGVVESSGIAVVGPGAVAPVSTSVTFTLDSGVYADGTRWIGLRGDAMIHVLAAGIEIRAKDNGSEVKVTPVNLQKSDEIRREVEAGSYFCNWRDLDYQWD